MRILLVEDDPQIGAAIVSALEDAGMVADWVTDGSAALASVEAGAFELMLLDIGLPKKDGLSVLKQVRHKSNRIPIIMITARDAVEDRIAGLDLGADDYLVKPFLIDELMARIRAVARRHSGNAQPLLSSTSLIARAVPDEPIASDQCFDENFFRIASISIRAATSARFMLDLLTR